MNDLKILTVFINQYIFNEREKFYKDLIKKNLQSKQYFEIILLGINENLQIKLMDRIEPEGPNNKFWELPYRIGKSLSYFPKYFNFSFETMFIDCLIHFKSEKNVQQIDFCIDINLTAFETSIRNFFKNKQFKDFIINEKQIIDLIK